jgi:zona occludens toxin
MITLYEGVPGSGKSLCAAGQILDQLSLGHLVICNFPFFPPRSRKYRRGALVTCSNEELSVDFLSRWYRIWLKFRCGGEPREHQIYLVIDEAGTVFNSRDWQSSGRREWLSFFAQHRKLMFDVVLIVQQDIMVDKQIRGCIDVLERFADIRKFFPDRGWYLPPIFKRSGRIYLSKNSRAGSLGTHFFRVRRSWAAAYDTFSIFNDASGMVSGASPEVELQPAQVPCLRWRRPLRLAQATGKAGPACC